MNTEISIETLKAIRNRAVEYALAKYGSTPDRIEISEEYEIRAIFETSCRGEWSEDTEYFDVDCLTANLDEVYAERKRLEDERKEKERLERERQNIEREKREKNERRQQYEKLKKEFE